ncbi:MAG: pyridoxal phosphate-dependent aminotransferase [Candidatus Marsarchaeota archaeon]|nr:pyridoxal phosphate-dependent aminotransferase [Candidatus Marsarchaeota archaeon]MCL5094896.1 pyridoxal phosphate-dependent aminotransferase [Candidatus Marsarchaeota archaeon]
MIKNIFSSNSKYALNPLQEDDALVEELIKKNKSLKITKLNIGDPTVYFPTPKNIINAYISALKNNKTAYSRPQGTKELINAVINRYKRLYNIKLQDPDIITTAGVSEALLFLNNALIDKNDSAILFKPYYSQFVPNLKIHGGIPIFGNYDEQNNWNIDIENLKKILKYQKHNGNLKRIKYMLIANPNNPTGTVLDKSILKQIVDIANEYNILLISDEIYDEIVYNNASFTSISQLAKGMPHIILNGMSKNFTETGFRIGFIIIPENDKLSNQLKKKFLDYALLRLSLNTPAQYAAVEALNNQKEHKKNINLMVKKIEQRSNFAYDLLSQNKYLEVIKPKGAFYIFPKFNHKKLRFRNDKDFTTLLLQEQGIQLTRGSGFGKEYHFRIVCLANEHVLGYAINKINILLDKYKNKF